MRVKSVCKETGLNCALTDVFFGNILYDVLLKEMNIKELFLLRRALII